MGIRSAWRELWRSNPEPIQRPRTRMFGGAQASRLTADWVTSVTSADQEIKGSLKRLRSRSRQLVRDNDYAKSAVRVVRNSVVGTGVRLQAQVMRQRGGKLDTRINEQIEKAWSMWGRKDSCNTAGQLCFADIEKLAVSSMCESGEVFIRMVRQKFGRSKVSFALEVLEADQLDEDYNSPATKPGNVWKLGVELDKFGRPVSYAFLSRHPGDTAFPTREPGKRHIIVPAKDVIHLFDRTSARPGQTRGVPWLASAMQRMHHLDGWEQASVVRARASSALMGFIQSPEGELDPGGEIYDEQRVTGFEPGQFKYLQPGETVTIPDMDSPTGEYEPFLRAQLRALGAGVGCSYEVLSNDYSQSNYSSSRLALLQDRDNWRSIQQMMKDQFYQPIYDAWLEMAVLSGALNLPTYETEPERYETVRWVCRGYHYVDPQKEIAAQKAAVRSGFKTLADCVAENGDDFDEFLVARQSELAKLDEMNIITDTDPSAVNGSGASQYKPANTIDAFGDTPAPGGEDVENVGEEDLGNY